MKLRWLLLSSLSVANAVGLTGCVFTRTAETPLSANWLPARGAPRGVVVFLPGLGDAPEDFVEHGFVALAHSYGYDTLTLDAHFGYYRDRTIKARLHDDVLAGLRERYEEVWLIGISLGGLGTALYCSAWDDEVTGVMLLAPYLGDADVWKTIEASGGLAAWNPETLTETDDRDVRDFRQMWAWLKRASAGQGPQLYVGIGADDGFRRPTGLIFDALAPSARELHPGGHRWTTWVPIFRALAARAFGESLASTAVVRSEGAR